MGGQDSAGLETIGFKINDTCTAATVGVVGTTYPIGNSTTIASTCSNAPGKNHVIGVGTWADGTKQVIIDQTL
jgi:hypothetical protein